MASSALDMFMASRKQDLVCPSSEVKHREKGESTPKFRQSETIVHSKYIKHSVPPRHQLRETIHRQIPTVIEQKKGLHCQGCIQKFCQGGVNLGCGKKRGAEADNSIV